MKYGVFKVKVNACILTHPISNYDFWGNRLNTPYFKLQFFVIPQSMVTNGLKAASRKESNLFSFLLER